MVPAPRIRTVLYFSNGSVAVCDEAGAQMPAYQGRLDDVRVAILRDAPADAEFRHWVLPDQVLRRDTFAELTEAD